MEDTDDSMPTFAELRREGIAVLERLTGGAWTDFNTHDPGITILEQACYVLTDFCYRTGFAIEDLLTAGESQDVDGLFGPAEILTCQPVTQADLRKLAMDVVGVKNAWVETVDEQAVPLHFHAGERHLSLEAEPPTTEPVRLKGLYRVLIEKSEQIDIDGAALQQAVAERLHANRGLCEDFEDIQLLKHESIRVHARIEIGEVEDATALAVDIHEAIAAYLSPHPRFKRLGELRAEGRRIDEIFDGPMLAHGFLDSETLQSIERRTAVYSSDLIRVISAVPGVRAVRNIDLGAPGKTAEWILELTDDHVATLDFANSSIVLQKQQFEVPYDQARMRADFDERQRRAVDNRQPDPWDLDIVRPRGRDRNLGAYLSMQQHMPNVYGVSTAGLPPDVIPKRRAQAAQLKAYMMLFDQQMANLHAQLAHSRELLGAHEASARGYYAQPVADDGLGLADVLRQTEPAAHHATLQSIMEESVGPAAEDRHNRFLNHLLARFAETFTDYSLMLPGAREEHAITPADKLALDKQAFLNAYPTVSAGRGGGIDYTRAPGADNTSGLARRISLSLGLDPDDGETFIMIEHILLRAVSGDLAQEVPLLEAARSKDPYSLQLSFVFPDWPPRFADAGFRLLVEQTVRAETPAHITPYVRWLPAQEMQVVRESYENWTEILRTRVSS